MSATANRRILCVDDEPRVLEGLESTLMWDFEVSTREGGALGLEAIAAQQAKGEPFGVIISDMRMPQMDGAQFLARARELSPEATRILLTGATDLNSAVAAINRGNIFRFLLKPCPHDELKIAVEAAFEQNRLILAERELLERTLNGAVTTLTEVLALAAPAIFSRAGETATFMRFMAERLGRDDWSYEMAGRLSYLGCITVPAETLDKRWAGQALNEPEQAMFDAHPEIGARLIGAIPRLEQVAEIVRLQQPTLALVGFAPEVVLGARMLRLAQAVDELVSRGQSFAEAVAQLRQRGWSDGELLTILAEMEPTQSAQTIIVGVYVKDLRAGMILEEDVLATHGQVLVPAGREVTGAILGRLQNFARGLGVVQPFRVRYTPTVGDDLSTERERAVG